MQLRKILKPILSKQSLTRSPAEVVIKGMRDVDITGITANSKQVAPGHLFIAKKGKTYHGARFIPEVVAAGAVAVATDVYDPFLTGIVQIIHPDVSWMESQIAQQYYEHADKALYFVGITGTNGKTTISYLVHHLLTAAQLPCGLVGTIEWMMGKNRFSSHLTTPDFMTNHKLCHEMVHNGCKAIVMEVSSHALDQGRVRDMDIDVAVFSNLTLDHLDYHQTMEHYAAAKAVLFETLSSGKHAVVNSDSPWLERIIQGCKAPILRYGLRPEYADLYATSLQLSPKGMQFKVHYGSEQASFTSPLIGRFNVYNSLAAMGVGLCRGMSLEAVVHALKGFKKVPGRLERLHHTAPLHVYVDYAHTDDALNNVLETLKEIKKRNIITIFGCGGNRDRLKRPKMAEAVERHSDLVVVTSDNPRQEDPQQIIADILVGFHHPEKVHVELDRKMAIEYGIRSARPEDIVLIAGKGHETYQIFAHKTVDFDDRKIALGSLDAIEALS
jgi:UDP-N-acetylmuramoyl-L-alanyl-D-glutamate--2,6-diaminopimelate ligase